MTESTTAYADVREMYEVHTMLRRELELAAALIPAVADGDTERAGIVADHIELMLQVLHGHHTAEDEHVWPRLLERAPGELAPFVHTMQTQHEAIDTEHGEVLITLPAWRETADADSQDAVAEALDRLLIALVQHLRLEEMEVVPLIAEHITDTEWAAVARASGSHVSAEQRPLLFGMLMYEADPEVIQVTVDHMPAEIRPVIKDLATSLYADYSERLAGTPTPPRHRR